MICLYYKQQDKKITAITDVLEALCLAHETKRLDSPADLPADMARLAKLPVLVDGKEVVSGYKNIRTHLEKLEAFHAEWTRFQSDACYCDADGNII